MNAIVQFRFYRSFLLLGFLANAVAFVFSFALATRFGAFVSFAVGYGSLCAVSFCIRCSKCGKSPYVWRNELFVVGSPVPERVCSKCGNAYSQGVRVQESA